MSTKINLGDAVNLTIGFDPKWEPGSNTNPGVFAAEKAPLKPAHSKIPQQTKNWALPTISLFDKAEDLLSAIFPFKVKNPTDGVKEAAIGAGHLLLGDKDRDLAIGSLSNTLGVDLGNPDYSYILVKIERLDDSILHSVRPNEIIVYPHPAAPAPELGVTDEFRKALVAIRTGKTESGGFDPEHFTAKHAQGCINLFEEWGTHFVSKITTGEQIFQVFALEQKAYQRVQKAMKQNDFSGSNFYDFIQYTSSDRPDKLGYVKAYGHVLCLSGDPVFYASIKAGKWNDKSWSETDNIFAPWLDTAGISTDALYNTFVKSAPIQYELTSLSIFAEFERRKAWKRVYKGVMIQKYKNAVTPHFSQYCPFDALHILPKSEIEGFASTIATRDINTFKPHTELDLLKFTNIEQTKTFTLCANLLSSSATEAVLLPGEKLGVLAQIAALESDGSIAEIQVSDKAFSSYKLHCGRFYGCLLITDTSGKKHETVLDGLKYAFSDTGKHGRYTVTVKEDVRNQVDPGLLSDNLDNVNFAFAFADAWLAGSTSPKLEKATWGIQEFALDTMAWLGKSIPSDFENTALLDLRIRAMESARSAMNSSLGVFVPLLPPVHYERQVDKILQYSDEIAREIRVIQDKIDARKTDELIHATAEALNKNIRDSGKMLAGFIQSSAAQQKELSDYYESIIGQKKSELAVLDPKVGDLEALLNKQQAVIENAIIAYKTAVEEKKISDSIQLGLDIMGTLFSLGAALAAPEAGEGLSELPEKLVKFIKTAKKLKKVLDVVKAGYDIYKSIGQAESKINAANQSLSSLEDIDFDINAPTSWAELKVDMELLLELGPDVGAAKENLKAAFSVLILRGQAFITTQAAASQLAREVYNHRKLQAMSAAQQARLNQIQTSLEPENIPKFDPLTIDLVGMTGHLMFVRSQMLSMLSKTFILHDQALQYQNLQPATAIAAFDLLNFKGIVVQQGNATVDAVTKLNAIQPTTTTPINIDFEAPAAQLVNGEVFDFTIHPDHKFFADYCVARVKGILIQVEGVEETDSGFFDIKLTCDGSPFNDRGLDGNVKTFRTPARERTYVFNVKTNKPEFIDNGYTWSEDVNPITPFSTWQLSFPQNKTNTGIQFKDSLLKITLSFTLEARILSKNQEKGLHRNIAPLAAVETATQFPPELRDLLKSMAGKSILNGWDVVFNMNLSKIQKAIDAQYDALKTASKFGVRIDVEFSYKPFPDEIIWTKLSMEYGYPKLTFADSRQVKLDIPILSGTVTKGKQDEDKPIKWYPPEKVTKNGSMGALVSIDAVAGIVKNSAGDNSKLMSVVLELAKGTFQYNFEPNENMDNASFNQAMIKYFSENKVVFVINTLDLSKIATIPDLQPHQFLYKALTTKRGNQILQLFISTNNRKAFDYSQAHLNNFDDPIPMDAECSMLISSKVFFSGVLPSILGQNGWHLAGIDPKDDHKAWSATFDAGTLTCNIDLSKAGYRDSTTHQDYSFWIPTGKIQLSIKGMSLMPKINFVHASCSIQKMQEFMAHIVYHQAQGYSEDKKMTTEYRLDISLDIEMKAGGEGQKQTLSFAVIHRDSNLIGHLSGGGNCGLDDPSAHINQQIKAQLPKQINELMNVSLSDVSVFALKNLLFPNNNYIKFQEVHIPGDLIITGKFEA